ncbi:MAG: PRC-barrel domain-containing protein [Clostridia bacterium]|nr:PRC-barrel domain-containing protein [Clostridia bacterium]
MLKGRQVLSLPILTLDKGIQLGEVKDLIYDPETGYFQGVTMEDGGWLWGAKIIRFEEFNSIGQDALTIAGEEAVCYTAKDGDAKHLYKNRKDITGYKVMTTGGKDLGTVEDILLQPETGKITGFEISDGVINDLLAGRAELYWDELPTIGEGTVVVADSFENIWQQQNHHQNV